MKSGIFKPALLALLVAAGPYVSAITSDDIEINSRERGSNLEVFSVEIRAPGGVRMQPETETPKRQTIPSGRLDPSKRAGRQNAQSAGAQKRDLGFFTYNGFPADYNVNKTVKTMPLETGMTLHQLAMNTKDAKVSVNQQIAAIYRKNFALFTDGNLDKIKPGVVLKIPTAQQAAAEDAKLARELIANHGVSRSEYLYALEHCRSGVCGMPSTDEAPKPSQPDAAAREQKNEPAAITLKDNRDEGVTYYQGDKKTDEQKPKGKEVAPVSESVLVLQDPNGKPTTMDEFLEQQKPKPSGGKTSVSGSALSFSGDSASALNAKGEIIDEVSKKYDGKFDEISSQIRTSNSDITHITQEVSDLRKQLEQQNSSLNKLTELLQKQQEEKKETAVASGEAEIPTALVAGVSGIIFLLLLIITYMSFRMRSKFRREMEAEADDDLGETGDFDHLMSLDPIAMVPTGAEDAAAIDSLAAAGAPGAVGGIDLNAASDEKPKQKTSSSFIIADDSSEPAPELDESTMQPADIGSSVVVSEDPSKREKVVLETSDDLVPNDLNPVSSELDESDFLSADSGKGSLDLSGDITNSDIDRIIKEADGGKSIEPDSPLAMASGTRGQPKAESARPADDDIDAILASIGDGPAEPAKPEARPADDDIDAILASMGESADPAPKKEEKPAMDDIDAILAEAAAPKKEEKPAADDIDAILAEAAAPKKEEKPAMDDIDAILAEAAAPKKEEKPDADDIDAILAEAAAPKKEEKPAADDIDAILAEAAAPKKEEKPALDDIDAILAEASAPKKEEKPETASSDDIDDILASFGEPAVKPEPDRKVANDDIDDILNSIATSSSESDPVSPLAVSEQDAPEAASQKMDADDIDALLEASAVDEPAPLMNDEEAKDNISLAKAFLSIDDKDAARGALEEIIKNASREYREEAEKMLSKL